MAILKVCGLAGAVLLTMAASASASASTQAAWTIAQIKSPQVPNGILAAQSCPVANTCEAVGSYRGPAGASLTVAETWNGTSWAIQPTPNPPSSHGSTLAAVSCQAANACTAVGSYLTDSNRAITLTEFWNGTAWHIQTSPDPKGSFGSYLTGVSCTAANSCTAVGYSNTQAFDSGAVAFAESWNGTAWTMQQVPNNGNLPTFLYAVSCTSTTACVATGSQMASGGGSPLAEVWNGTSWSTQTPALPNGGFTSLTGVSCTSATACTAVGNYSQSHRPFATLTLAETWNGTTWAIQPTPNPGGWGSLDAVSCTAATSCTAVGWGTQQEQPLAVVWNGSAWTAQTPAQPAGIVRAPLTGVSCPAAGACRAVGAAYFMNFNAPYLTSPGVSRTLAEVQSGSAWTIQVSPSPSGALGAQLNAVSCPAATSCVAVGTVAESWNGTTWKSLPIGLSPGAVTINLSAVSCTSVTACLAVGSYTDSSAADHALAESWNGGRWRILPPPAVPSGAVSAALSGVSCTAGACQAVGSYADAFTSHTLAESWNGTAWHLETTVDPNSRGNTFAAVSCVSASDCTAVGGALLLPLVETWNGSTWSQQPIATAGFEDLTSVSCTSATFCGAAGEASGKTASSPEAATWNGTTWTIKHLPEPPNSFEAELNGVSCTSASACTAVGSDFQNNFGVTREVMAAVWNGTTWALQPAPTPPHVQTATLNGIACGVAGGCIAVGSHGWNLREFGVDVPFAEHGS